MSAIWGVRYWEVSTKLAHACQNQHKIRTLKYRYSDIVRLTLGTKILGWKNVFLYREAPMESCSKDLVLLKTVLHFIKNFENYLSSSSFLVKFSACNFTKNEPFRRFLLQGF